MSETEIELSETEDEILSQTYAKLLWKMYKVHRKLYKIKNRDIEKFDDWAVNLPESIHEKLYMEAFAYMECIN